MEQAGDDSEGPVCLQDLVGGARGARALWGGGGGGGAISPCNSPTLAGGLLAREGDMGIVASSTPPLTVAPLKKKKTWLKHN